MLVFRMTAHNGCLLYTSTSASIEGGQNLNLAVPIHKINSLTKDTCVALSTLAGSEKVVVSSSAASVTVARGAAQTIEITMNTSKFYSVIYQTNNKNVATGQWGEWTSNTSIPLTIYGIGPVSYTHLDVYKRQLLNPFMK